jgi:hypothetical protein
MRREEVICFECGFRYNRRISPNCPKCGEARIYLAALHSPNYDIAKDPSALFKLRLYGVAGFIALFILMMNITH